MCRELICFYYSDVGLSGVFSSREISVLLFFSVCNLAWNDLVPQW